MERLKRIWQAANVVVTFFVPSPQHAVAADLKLTLVIYDYARLSEVKLGEVESTASEIFQRAGVQLLWVQGFAYAAQRRDVLNPAREDPATLVVKLQPESEAFRYGVRSVCGGIGFESGAIVFVRGFDSTRLGYVMAHELGHIVLGPNAHAIVGIMRGTLLPEDWKKAAQGTLGFTHSQKQQIRMWIDQRSRRCDRVPEAGATTELGAKVTVRLYDYAAVPHQTLAEAEREASRIFREAAVNLLWMECGPVQNNSDPDACEQLGESMRLVMKVLPETMAIHLHRPPRVFGMSVQQDAFIFFDRVQELCGVENLSLSLILGHTMAHELGHMVLGQREHSASGIMMETIRRDALKQAEKGHLLFTPQQAAEMRARVRSQTEAQRQYALPDAEIGVNTTIFYERIERFQESSEIDLSTLLGHAMAHEIGHVLLGTTEHSPAGIMKARWGQADFRVPGLRVMKFTATQRAEIQHRELIARQQIPGVSSEKRMTEAQTAAPEPVSVTVSTEAKLVVRLYDYAQVPRRALTWAEQEAARVFQVAGIQLSWVEYGLSEADQKRFLDCAYVDDPMHLFVNIIPQLMAEGLPRPDKFGTSFGTHAVVFHHQVEETAADEGFSKSLILGYVMAHELGHLLLGENSHGQGIMRGTFGRRDFERAAKGELIFTPQQAEQMRTRILKTS